MDVFSMTYEVVSVMHSKVRRKAGEAREVVESHAKGVKEAVVTAIDDIVKALKQGQDANDTGLCPPMPAGPMAAFGGLTDEDAMDIANYLLSQPPVENVILGSCEMPTGPPPGP